MEWKGGRIHEHEIWNLTQNLTFLSFGYLKHYDFSAENVKQEVQLYKVFLIRLFFFP